MTTSPEHEKAAAGQRLSAMRLSALFALVYFVQGIGEPSEGLLAQPIRHLLQSWNEDNTRIGIFMGLLGLPWSIKPLYGLLSDFVPLAGYRRKSYLILTSGVTAAALLTLGYIELSPKVRGILLCLLLVPSVGIAFSDVLVDAIMVEKGQPRGLTGIFQSVQWTALYGASILNGFVGGYLSQHNHEQWGFVICGSGCLLTFVVTLFAVSEDRSRPNVKGLEGSLVDLWRSARGPAILAIGGFLFLWNFNPFSSAVLQSHMTDAMGMNQQFYGNTQSILAGAAMVASLLYGFYCRLVPMRRLVHGSIGLGVAATILYWAMSGEISACIVSAAVGFASGTAIMIQLDLAAQFCPPEKAGTIFALLMSLSNLGTSLSTMLGGYLYDVGTDIWNRQVAFNLLVGVGALFTAGCWLLIPYLNAVLSGKANEPVADSGVGS